MSHPKTHTQTYPNARVYTKDMSSPANGGGRGGRNGQTLNHLLSFTLPPRARPPPPSSNSTRRGRRAANYVPFNKERYINAQYRFLVKPTGDYTAHFADPDIYLNWSDILQILIPTTSALSAASGSSNANAEHEGATCPICLSPPTAPRMTKCGHVYCYPCMLHYLTVGEETGTINFSRPAQPEIGSHAYARPGAPSNRRPGGSGSTPGSGTSTPGVGSTSGSQSAQPKKWRRCPICWDAVYARDLKAVKWWDPKEEARKWATPESTSTSEGQAFEDTEKETHPEKEAGVDRDFLSLRLIERPLITTLALPQSDSWPGTSDDDFMPPHSAPWHFQPDVLPFAKFMLATPTLIEDSLKEDLTQLEIEKITLETMPGGRDETSLIFVQAAREKVLEQIEKVRAECDTVAVKNAIARKRNQMQNMLEERQAKVEVSREHQELKTKADQSVESSPDEKEGEEADSTLPDPSVANDGVQDFLEHQAQSQGGKIHSPASAVPMPPRKDAKPRRNVNPPSPSSSSYFYYQAASGQNIFLHPLDIKVLHSKFGTYAAFPRTIHVKVSGADEGSMNEDLRRRCKYLTHIPTAADVVFIEVDWEAANTQGPDMKKLQLNHDELKPYIAALRQRKNRRRDKGRKEDRAKLKADEEAAAAASRVRQIAPSQEYKELAFQRWKAGEAGSFGSAGQLSSSLDSAPSASNSPSFREAALVGGEQDFPIHPGGPLEDFPAVPNKVSEHPHSSASFGTTVWGTPAAAKTAFTEALQRGSRSAEDEMWERDMDDAWLELEEDFLLGATPGGRRNTGAVKEGRGLNKQPKSGLATPKTPTSANGLSRSPRDSPMLAATDQESSADANTPTRPAGKQKKVKKKLVLTSGGRGTA